MYAADQIRALQQELSLIFGPGQLLLGGSYLYAEAQAGSDLDFYAIVGWRIFFRRKKYYAAVRRLHAEHPDVDFSVMIVPRLFFKRGWYYVYGRDLQGIIYRSPINRRIVFGNSLKLAWQHYLDFQTQNDAAQKNRALRKAVQLAALAAVSAAPAPPCHPLMSRQHLAQALRSANSSTTGLLAALFNATADSSTANSDTAAQAQSLREIFLDLEKQSGSFLTFSLFNYLFYNIIFLRRGSGRFLFRNPNAAILKELRSWPLTPSNVREIKQYILPVWII